MDRVHPGQAEPAGERPGLAAGTAPRDCVFTILTGDYEALNEQPVASRSRLPFICLTDDPGLSSASWQIRLIESRFAMDPVRSQRILKLRPEGVLGGFDRSLYIDNSVILKAPPEELFSRHLDGASLALFEHSYRDTLADEFLEVARTALDDPARIFEQLNHYVACHPEVLEQKPLWTGILLRDHRDPRLDALQSLWLDHVLRYSRRDQLSINLALSQSGLRPRLIAGDNFATALHSWPQAPGRDRWKGARSVVASQAPPSARLRGLEREHEALQRTLAAEEARHRGEESALRQGLEDRSREIAMLRQALGDRDRDVAALRGSTSWRLTGPLRALSRAARGLLRPGSPGPTALPAAAAAGPAGQFAREGFLGPVPLLTAAQCALLLRHLEGGCAAPRPDWPKTLGAADSLFGGIAARPAILALLRPVLGPDIVLWGASVVTRQPGQRHIWHVDIESATADGPSASLWIGLRNTARDSALQLVSRSHRHGKPVQQEVAERGLERGQAADETVLGWARRRDRAAALVQPEMRDGDGLLLDGRLWHASHNRSGLARSALLLQYAAAEVAVGIPVFEHVAWPFRLTGEPAPRVLVCGRDRRGDARPVPSPCPPQAAAVATTLHDGTGFEPGPDGWKPHHLLQGPTPNIAAMHCHVSVLSPGHCPHPVHAHAKEELLIVLDGEAEVLIGDAAHPEAARVERLAAGSFAYYPAYQGHTIRNVSATPVTYLMYRWEGAPVETERPLETAIVSIGEPPTPLPPGRAEMRLLLEGPTGYLGKLHAHVTTMPPGAGYPAHVDGHDVAILLFAGTIATAGRRFGPRATLYHPAGHAHGLRNPGDEVAHYLVFEFHGAHAAACQDEDFIA